MITKRTPKIARERKLKLGLIASALAVLAISVPQTIHGTEEILSSSTTKKSSSIQLKNVSDHTLEAVLGTGNNVLLKMAVDLKGISEADGQEKQEVPARFFLTDFTSSTTSHPDVHFFVKVDSGATTSTYFLPDKPTSFDSEAQFTNWLNQAYFINQIKITYDFDVDVEKVAPSLAKELFSLPSGGYRFIGTHAVGNQKISPDDCSPKISYLSQRGKVNTTTVTMGGTLYLNKKAHAIEDHHQTFPHPVIDEKVFKTDDTKRFYNHNWLALTEVTAKTTYQEFPSDLVKGWPQAPSGTYSLLQQKPDDLNEIKHIACWDGTSGNEVDIADGRIFSVICEAVSKSTEFTESVVKGNDGNLYTVHYKPTLIIPLIAKGYEQVYKRFLNGRLIYKPNPNSDDGRIELRISDLVNPLEGTFDLSKCGNVGTFFSISTGYRKGKKAENAIKVEIWLTPRFLIEKELNTTAGHFKDIFPAKWAEEAPVGIFWNSGGQNELTRMDYITNQDLESLSCSKLGELRGARVSGAVGYMSMPSMASTISYSFCELK